MRKYLVYLLAVTFSAQVFGQPDVREFRAEADIDLTIEDQNTEAIDSLYQWKEHLVLQLDRTAYRAGDPLFFKGVLQSGPNNRLGGLSRVLHLDIRNSAGETIESERFPIRSGKVQGGTALPKNLDAGTYELRFYTQWMGNYGPAAPEIFRIKISEARNNKASQDSAVPNEVNSSLEPPRYFPEGGELIAGIKKRIVFTYSTSELPAGKAVGYIRSLQSDQRIPIIAYDQGLAMAYLEPDANSEYVFTISGSQELPLADVRDSGYSIAVNSLNKKNYKFAITQSGIQEPTDVFITGSNGGFELFRESLRLSQGEERFLEVPKANLPAGKTQVVVSDQVGNELSSTYIDVLKDQNDGYSIALKESQVLSDGSIQVTLTALDSNGKPVASEFAVSAIQGTEDSSGGFESNLIQRNYRDRQFINDLRAIATENFTSIELPLTEIIYPYQSGLEFRGRAYNLYDKLLQNTRIQVAATTDDGVVIREVQTNSGGYFTLDNLDLEGEVQLVFRTEAESEMGRLVKVKQLASDFDGSDLFDVVETKGKSLARGQTPKSDRIASGKPQKYRREPANRDGDFSEIRYDTKRLIALEEATVEARKKRPQITPLGAYGVIPLESDIVFQDPENPKPTFSLVRQLPGLVILGEGTTSPQVISLRGRRSQPVWVLDGRRMSISPLEFAPESNPEPRADWDTPFFLVPATDIERIEYTHDRAQTSRFGPQAEAAGVLMIYTISGGKTRFLNRKDGSITYQGYKKPVDFDETMSSAGNRSKKHEGEQTVYWNPELKTDENGEVTFSFSPTDTAGEVRIKALAINAEGRVVRVDSVLDLP
ncbi:hypothetical protein SAMN04490243_2175 [Robiginitalea myxolifaciens]|uniref:MG2 domain-containing protein n=1 Tax=Robiginitalea myxolifaciens TaxID=400055 RepID=A0A1I6H362_9FLAO|nr:hypothetical protein [Robiginitalea myxolifaciens]SFR48852.1 hypothetical protein SAMN04490243_2175 [Robiginitalea myxolifaciens]